MFLQSILLLASTIAGFTIPKDTPDGVYAVYTNEAGEEIMSLVNLSQDTVSQTTHDIANNKLEIKRQIPFTTGAITCAGYQLDADDTNAAVADLVLQCNTAPEFLPSGAIGPLHFTAISGCTVAYFCNFAATTEICVASDAFGTFNLITQKCGSFAAGWDRFSGTNIDATYGYEDFCGAGHNYCDLGGPTETGLGHCCDPE